ncbi:hypothetical protein BMF94_6740 [Rhodotorula taiwanensis]|uniref:Uncharacterized protein n=1 Tax=Rhodotorula taiwanensis TaxID=741276 RepID=A0A2S5B055_9BASI|nr:hypothetical protein BMF94_6740 [Rhodotorula taiwanensis]
MSVRTSMYPNAFQSSATLSHSASSNSSTASSSAALLQEVLQDKQREYEAFEAIRAQARHLGAVLAAFRDKYSVLNGAVGDVVEHWQNVFRITALTLGSLAERRVALAPTVESNDPADVVLPAGTLPDKLVRIPVRPADEEEALLAQQQQQQQQQAPDEGA